MPLFINIRKKKFEYIIQAVNLKGWKMLISQIISDEYLQTNFTRVGHRSMLIYYAFILM